MSLPRRPGTLRRLGREIYHSFLLPRKMQRTVVRGGIRYSLSKEYFFGRRMLRYGVHEEKQVAYFFPRCRELGCEIFLDVGAYFGFYSLLAAKLKLFSQIHAVEASPVTYPQLQRQISINDMQDEIQTYMAAVSDAEREASLTDSADLTEISETGTIKIRTKTLNSMFAFGGERIAIKLDVEHHALAALGGGEQLFANNAVFLQVEVLPGMEQTIIYLLEKGWKLVHHHEDDFYFLCPRMQREAGSIA